ncbi:hypothetical protein SUGI_1061300 [Cryptomeria japonica]|nr:hypothetical protein SUGI_1061300 [Cryptomeria japonica]
MDLHVTQNKNFHLNFVFYISLQIIIQTTLSHSATTNCSAYCGNIPLQHPFGSTQGCGAFPYKQMLQCDHKAQKVNLRTTYGLFEVQGIDYKTQTMTISDPSMSTCSSLNPITHQHFSMDSVLPPTPHNTILLLNCPLALASSGLCKNISQILTASLPGFLSESCHKHCGVGLKEPEQGSYSSSSLPCCATDFERLGNRSLGELQCKHYVNVYGGVEGSKWGYGIRLSFNLPDQIPDVRLCDECDKQDGNCGIGIKCICHPHECGNVVAFHHFQKM